MAITVGNDSVGGNVVALLIRQKELKKRQSLESGSYGVQNPTPFIAGVPVTTRMQEATSYKADVTQHAVESGVILSDHVILQPITIELSFDITNLEENYVKQAQELLEKLHATRTPINLQTEHKQLPNMIMTSLQIDNSAPQWGKLNCRAGFQQLTYVTLESEEFSATKVKPEEQTGGPATPKSAETPINNGRQTTRRSTLQKLFKGAQ